MGESWEVCPGVFSKWLIPVLKYYYLTDFISSHKILNLLKFKLNDRCLIAFFLHLLTNYDKRNSI